MNPSLCFLAVLNAVFLLSAFGCGDEGGCGPDSQKEGETSGGGRPGYKSSPSGAAELVTSDNKEGRVPKPYQRPASKYAPAKSTATISKPIIVVAPRRAPVRVTKRKVDGIADRVELKCRIITASSDGKCSGAANYAEIKERCCPGGIVERCSTSMDGVVLVGRGCEPVK